MQGFKIKEYFCGAERDRTADLMTASHALSQLSYSPKILSYIYYLSGPSGLPDSYSFLDARFSGALTSLSTDIIANIDPVVG